MSYTKKEGLSSRQPNLYLTLKSNTMKNTLQKYCFFATPPNVLAKKCAKKHIFLHFANYTMQNSGFCLRVSKKCSIFVGAKQQPIYGIHIETYSV